MNFELMATYPSVYVVEREYQVCVLVNSECTMWVQIGEKNYYDHSNGILRSGKFLHIAHVPQKELDEEGRYTVHLRKINERKPYYTDFGEVESTEFVFHPIVKKDEYHIINLADAHNLVDEPIASGGYFGDDLDLLIMNGDIPNHSGDIKYFKGIYLISGGISKGRVPCVFSRGNHDMRGIYADQLADYTPTNAGKSYYTFRAGPIWGIVLDAGEDKPDSNPAYGHTICCEAFREEEGEFLDAVIAAGEYKEAPVRLIICHHPFVHKVYPPFTIEVERYQEWARKLKEIKPTLWLSGHLHPKPFLEAPGGEHDDYGYPCALVCSAFTDDNLNPRACGAVTLTADEVNVKYVSEKGEIKGEQSLPLV